MCLILSVFVSYLFIFILPYYMNLVPSITMIKFMNGIDRHKSCMCSIIVAIFVLILFSMVGNYFLYASLSDLIIHNIHNPF